MNHRQGLPLTACAVVATLLATASPTQATAEDLDFSDLDALFDSVIRLDNEARTVTLPLFEGENDGQTVYYVVIDASDRETARAEGVNYAPVLANALGSEAVQEASLGARGVIFEGTVDFSPELEVVPDPAMAFPPIVATPGSSGDAQYTPLFSTGDGIVFNAPHIANASGVHDDVVAIDRAGGTVTLALAEGIYGDKEVLYLSTDASDPTAAALESATFAPAMNAAPGLASNDRDRSARSALILVINGETGENNPERQGITSALLGEGDPVNILSSFPNNRRGSGSGYSPLWDVHPAVFTDPAIEAGLREFIGDADDIDDLLEDGIIESGGAGPRNRSLGGLRAAGLIVNCPLIAG